MAVYKVPQDVEADDKLIGPFSFRQFIYLIIVALLSAIAWWMAQLFVVLVAIPLPFIIFFGALALPLRKDQPMEVYLAAMVSFYLKPHKRLWDADGIDSLIEITVPKSVEVQLTKDISRGEAEERLGYLAQIVDSQGWAVRGQGAQTTNSALNNDVYYEAQQVEDVLDSDTSMAQSLDYMIGQSDAKRHKEMLERLHQQPTAPAPIDSSQQATPAPVHAPVPTPYNFFADPAQPTIPTDQAPAANTSFQQPTANPPIVSPEPPTFNPYPTNIQQSVIQPLSPASQTDVPTTSNIPVMAPTPTTSEKPVSPDIINLANNADLSIETIAREANRIHDQTDMNEEVVISLR